MLVEVDAVSPTMAERYGAEEAQIWALHGWGRSRHDWAPVLKGLSALAIDLPGFGASRAPQSAWGTIDYAKNLLPAIESGGRKLLVGHSFGGRVSVQLAALAPERVSGLILTGVPLTRLKDQANGRIAFSYRAARYLWQRGLVSDAWMERQRRRYGSRDYAAASGLMRDVLVKAVNEDYSEQLRAIASAGIKTVLVWGERDTVAPLTHAEAASAILGRQSELRLVQGSSHLIDSAMTAQLRGAIEEFSAEC